MKKILFLFFYAMLLLVTGCGNDLLNLKEKSREIELPANGDIKVIKAEANGIGIEFCLLNEDGEPATTFREGENFRFRLTISNNIQKDSAMYVVSDFLKNPTLFAVYNANGEKTGRPVRIEVCLERTDAGNKLKNGERWEMEVPWVETRTFDGPFEPNTIRFLQCYFSGLNQQPLPKGSYFTRFTQKFCLGRYLPHPQSETVCTDELVMKINFEIR